MENEIDAFWNYYDGDPYNGQWIEIDSKSGEHYILDNEECDRKFF